MLIMAGLLVLNYIAAGLAVLSRASIFFLSPSRSLTQFFVITLVC